MPAPRCIRVNGYGASSLIPVLAAMRPAAAIPLPYSALPPISIAVRRPDRSIAATRSTFAPLGGDALGKAGTSEMTPPSPQATSAGTIRVAILPGPAAATIAAAASRPHSAAAPDVRHHL